MLTGGWEFAIFRALVSFMKTFQEFRRVNRKGVENAATIIEKRIK